MFKVDERFSRSEDLSRTKHYARRCPFIVLCGLLNNLKMPAHFTDD